MDRYQPSAIPRRRRRGPFDGRRRHARVLARDVSASTWLALALLLALLLSPARGTAQGFKSAVASVALVAIKPDSTSVRDHELPRTVASAPVSVSVRLRQGTTPLYVRVRGGRLELLDATWRDVDVGVLHFRDVRPAGGVLPEASWHIEIRTVDARTGEIRSVEEVVGTR
jgi:hypothetical protein